jgi:hypothetical protein
MLEPMEPRLLLSADLLPTGDVTGAGPNPSAAIVMTDKANYAPGETAVILGTGFESGETVELQVLHNDGTLNTGGGHEPWWVTDGSGSDLDGLLDGNIQTTWYVNPDESLNSFFDLTAIGLSSGLVASTTFTDSGTEIAFVDPTVWDAASVPHLLSETVDEVVFLDANSDGIQQIADFLAGRTGISAVHIFSHGRIGEISPVGSGALNNGNLSDYAGQLATIGSALTEEGDVLLWGCAVAGTDGTDFVQSIASMTGADVAASDDLTGSPARGGDWDLEYATGPIEAITLSSALASNSMDPALNILLTAFVWDGGGADSNWTTAQNWASDVAPSANDDLIFPVGAARLTNVNNFASGTQFSSILFQGSSYNVSGNQIVLNGAITNNGAGNTFGVPIAWE